MGSLQCLQGQRSHILPGFRESALRASRAMVGAPLKAEAGRATTMVRLQTIRMSRCFDEVRLSDEIDL